ncbi:hypothetical protein [Stratiformator vulcanicus]|nr:hypothetical protein [Stratiformator vulcanicus]
MAPGRQSSVVFASTLVVVIAVSLPGSLPAVLCCSVAVGNEIVVRIDPPDTQFEVGEAADESWAGTIPGAVWDAAPLRNVCEQLGTAHRLSILVDRRIDPSRPISLRIGVASVAAVVEKIAAEAGGRTAHSDGLVLIAPPLAAERFEPLLLRTRERMAQVASSNNQLRKEQTFRWGDLAEPRQIASEIATRFELQIENPEEIPHDLWPRGVLPQTDAAAAMTAVLIQFDRTIDIDRTGRIVRIVPIPDRIVYSATYRPKKTSAAALAEWRRRWPDAEFDVRRRVVTLRGEIADHAQFSQEVPLRETGKPPVAPTDVVLLKDRRFTLSAENVPVTAIIANLESTGVQFQYDAAALRQAGVDLNQRVTLDLRSADATAFLKAVFEPLGLRSSYSGVIVELSPITE